MGKWCTPLRSICVSLSPSDGTHGCVLVAGDTSTPVVLADTVGKRVWGQHLVPINSLTNSHPHMLLNAAHPVSILHGIDGYLQPKSGTCWECGKMRKQAEFRIVEKVLWGAGLCYCIEWRCRKCSAAAANL
jgi:hypothetical protein